MTRTGRFRRPSAVASSESAAAADLPPPRYRCAAPAGPHASGQRVGLRFMIPQMLRRLGLGNRLEGRSGQVYYSPVFLGDLRPADYRCLIAKHSPSGVLGIPSRKKASEETET